MRSIILIVIIAQGIRVRYFSYSTIERIMTVLKYFKWLTMVIIKQIYYRNTGQRYNVFQLKLTTIS